MKKLFLGTLLFGAIVANPWGKKPVVDPIAALEKAGFTVIEWGYAPRGGSLEVTVPKTYYVFMDGRPQAVGTRDELSKSPLLTQSESESE